jgi:iron complex transport system permease protein
MALFVGVALSISGLVYQETFQNRLVSPDILGVSSGASVGVALGLLIGLPVMYISFFGFVLGLVSMLATLALAKVFKNKTPTILILSGVIVSGFMTSILSIIKTAANTDTVLPAITYWLLGSFDKVEMSDVFIIAPFIIVGSTIMLVIRWQINVIALGEEEAVTKGINYKGYRLVIILVATLITASSVAFAGVIGWIGLVIPHIVRLLIGRNTKYTVPLCMTLGAAFMIIADILSRSIFQAEIPLSAITGFIGVPIFVLILSFVKNEVNNSD